MKEPEPGMGEDKSTEMGNAEITAGEVSELNAAGRDIAGRDITQIINNYQNMDKDQLRELVEEMVHASIMGQIEDIDTESPATPEEVAKGEKTLIEAEAAREAGINFDPDELIRLSGVANKSGNVIIAEGYVREALRLYELNRDRKGMSRAKNDLGFLKRERGDHEGALLHFKEALKISIDADYSRGRASSLGAMAWSLAKLGEKERSYRLFNEALEIHRSLPENNSSVETVLNNFGSIMITDGNLSGGQELLEEALSSSKERNAPFLIETVNLGRIALFKGEFEKAKSLMEEARTGFERESHQRGVGTSLYYLGRISLFTGDYSEAEQLATECREIFKQSGDDARAALVSDLLVQIAERSTLNEIVDF